MKDLIIPVYLAPLTVVCEPSMLSKKNGSKINFAEKATNTNNFFFKERILKKFNGLLCTPKSIVLTIYVSV